MLSAAIIVSYVTLCVFDLCCIRFYSVSDDEFVYCVRNRNGVVRQDAQQN